MEVRLMSVAVRSAASGRAARPATEQPMALSDDQRSDRRIGNPLYGALPSVRPRRSFSALLAVPRLLSLMARYRYPLLHCPRLASGMPLGLARRWHAAHEDRELLENQSACPAYADLDP